jgi:hypothetical protein
VMAGDSLADRQIGKALRLVGQVTLSTDGELLDLVVDSADALPGDLMRTQSIGRDAQTLAETIAGLRVATSLIDPSGSLADPLAQLNLRSLVDIMKDRQAQQETAFDQLKSAIPSVLDIMKDHQAHLTTLMSGIPTALDIMKDQQATLMSNIPTAFDILKDQQAKLMSSIPTAFDIMKDQEAHLSTLMSNIPTAFDIMKDQQSQLTTLMSGIPGMAGLAATYYSSSSAPITQRKFQPGLGVSGEATDAATVLERPSDDAADPQ